MSIPKIFGGRYHSTNATPWAPFKQLSSRDTTLRMKDALLQVCSTRCGTFERLRVTVCCDTSYHRPEKAKNDNVKRSRRQGGHLRRLSRLPPRAGKNPRQALPETCRRAKVVQRWPRAPRARLLHPRQSASPTPLPSPAACVRVPPESWNVHANKKVTHPQVSEQCGAGCRRLLVPCSVSISIYTAAAPAFCRAWRNFQPSELGRLPSAVWRSLLYPQLPCEYSECLQ